MRVASERLSDLGTRWRDALSVLCVRHPNRLSAVECRISDDDVLTVQLDETVDTRDLTTPMRAPFVISCVRLACWPGADRAREWFAAGFAGYCMHEALELVTFGGAAVLDPHEQPYAENTANRCLRDGFPPVLTEETLARAMRVVLG